MTLKNSNPRDRGTPGGLLETLLVTTLGVGVVGGAPMAKFRGSRRQVEVAGAVVVASRELTEALESDDATLEEVVELTSRLAAANEEFRTTFGFKLITGE